MPVRRGVQADEDIISIYVESIRQFGVQQADRYMNGLEDVLAMLSQFPRIARERLEIRPPVRVHPYGAHLIVYTLGESDEVYVLRVRHGHEDWQDDPL